MRVLHVVRRCGGSDVRLLSGYPRSAACNRRRPYAARVTQLPALAVITVCAAGLAVAAFVDWELGAFVLGLGLLIGAGLRLTLPVRAAGWLAVRTRGLDAAILLALGFAVVALANTIPRP